jgi:orotidine-5'-phosphate decarboxylase
MGTDSVKPFLEGFQSAKGMYVLNRTSNPGARDLQGLTVADNMVENITDTDYYPLHVAVARRIALWAAEQEGTGAVVGATSLQELAEIASFYAARRVPLLIPGVGSQGASAKATMQVLREARYPLELARINSSSALTHPWKKAPAPKNWLEQCVANISGLLQETAL